jgi:predicted aspartyl protease
MESALRHALTSSVLFASTLSVKTTFLIAMVGAQTVTVRVPMNEIAGREIVQVSINGTGPYDFILDTGSNFTMVQSKLIRNLNISSGPPVAVVTALGAKTPSQLAVVEKIAVAGLTVEHLEINMIDRVEALEGRAQGILGENFLKHFDVLIDNEKQVLTLDRTSSLADMIAGERLPFSRFGSLEYATTLDRIVVELKVPSFLGRPMFFLVDSGSNTAALYPAPGGVTVGAMKGSHHASLHDLNERRDCRVQKTTLEIGRGIFPEIQLVACEGITRTKMDTDGLLPTSIFRWVFVSHTGGYVVVNPYPTNK